MDTINEESDTSPIPPHNIVGRETSDVWSIFSKIEETIGGKKIPLSKCGICKKKLSRSASSGTNHLRRHLQRHADAPSQDIRNQMQIGQDSLGNISKFSFDKAIARREVVDFVIRAELPFTFVEKHDFKGFIQRAFTPQYTGISASTCKRDKVNQMQSCKLAVPNEQDWLIAELVGGFLEVFRSATKICCGIYYPTSNRVINCLFDIHQTFEAYSHLDVFNDALVAMKTKFDKYWYDFPLVFCCTTVMDPRFKLFSIEEWLKCMGRGQLEIDGIIQSIKYLLYKYYDVYKRNIVPSVILSYISASSPLSTTSGSLPIPRVQSYSMQSLKRAKISFTSSSSNNNSDLQIYLDLATIEVDDDNQFSLLGWWKANQPLYPILSLMARDLLSVPASTVASEAAFSAGGRVVSEKRASLNPNTIEALICSKDFSLAKSRKQDSVDAEESVEELSGTMSSRPDWMIENEGGGIEVDSEEDSATQNESGLLTLPYSFPQMGLCWSVLPYNIILVVVFRIHFPFLPKNKDAEGSFFLLHGSKLLEDLIASSPSWDGKSLNPIRHFSTDELMKGALQIKLLRSGENQGDHLIMHAMWKTQLQVQAFKAICRLIKLYADTDPSASAVYWG